MVSRFRQHRGRPVVDLTGRIAANFLWTFAVAFACQVAACPAWADSTGVDPGLQSQPADSGRAQLAAPVSVPDSADQKRVVDSLMASLRADSTTADTLTPVSLRAFVPPNVIFDSAENANNRIGAVPAWPLPKPADLAACDLADWLVFQPPYDVDHASGPGQSRRYTKWGLIERRSRWDVDGQHLYWQRLDFPQTAQFDPVILPSFEFDSIRAGDELRLRRDPEWPYRARSSYFLRQGDYGETYSQGDFRRVFARGYGVDLGFTFYENDGYFLRGSPDNRYLRLHLVGPLTASTFWSARFVQFRDRTVILPPSTYFGMRPERDDLLYVLEGSAYHPPDSSDSSTGWSAVVTLQAGKHDIRDRLIDYQLLTRDKHWTVWGRRMIRGWLLDGDAMWETLDAEGDDPSRWGVTVSGQRTVPVPRLGAGLVEWTISDWETEPPALEFTAAVSAADSNRSLIPTVRLERTRIIPSLFDRLPKARSNILFDAQSPIVDQYIEIGDPSLDAEWRNEAAVILATPLGNASRFDFSLEGHVAYVERYTRWLNVSVVPDTAIFRPQSNDARTVGLGVAMHAPLFWKLEGWLNYAAKYAETTEHIRLPGYYPHKASAIISWIAPQFRYKIDLRINSALLWWYGDRRIDPTPYTISPHVIRWDLSASARMGSFTFYYSVQNVTNFSYRTREGQDYAVRRMRFGFDWRFID